MLLNLPSIQGNERDHKYYTTKPKTDDYIITNKQEHSLIPAVTVNKTNNL